MNQAAFDKLKEVSRIKFAGSITYVGKDNPTSYSTLWLNTDHGNNTKVANITFQYNNERQLFRGETNGGYGNATVDNCTFNAYLEDFPTNKLRLIEFTTGLSDSDGPVMIFKNSKVNISAPANRLNFLPDEYEVSWLGTVDPKVVPIRIGEEFTFSRATNNRQIIFDNNDINISVSKDDGNVYATLNGIMLSSSHAQFTNNNVSLTGEKYIYGMFCTSYSSYNNISNNIFKINGERYTAGIYLSGGYLQNNIIANNNITLVSSNDKSEVAEDSGYPIVIEDRRYIGGQYPSEYGEGELFNNTVIHNNITVSGNNVYAIEHYGGANTTIKRNRINASGNTPTGIAVTGFGISVEDNIVYITANSNNTGSTADYFPAMPGGIYAQYSYDCSVKNNKVVVVNGSGITAKQYKNFTVTGNRVNASDEYAAVLTECNDSEVSYNELISKSYQGDDAVSLVDGQNVSSHDNQYFLRDKTFLNVTLETQALRVGEYIRGNITLIDEEDNPLSTSISIISPYSKSTVRTMENGEQEFRIKVSKFVENPTILFIYNGDSHYANCSTEVPFDIIRNETTLTVNKPKDILPNTDLTINGTLKDNNNRAIANAKVTVTFNDKEYNVTTDDNGLFKADVTTPAVIGRYFLTARYNGTNDYNASQETVSLLVGQTETVLSVNKSTDVIAITKNMTINGTLSDINNNPIANATIKIEVDGMDEVNVITDGKGEYYYSFKTTTVSDRINVKVSYAGDTKYADIDNSTWFSVKMMGSQISVDKLDNADPGSELKITGKVSESSGVNTGIADAVVYITINGQEYNTTADENGNYVKTVIAPDDSKTYTVSVEYKGSNIVYY